MNHDLTIKELGEVLSKWMGPVAIAYSGGKDSSAVLKLAFNAAMRSKFCGPVHIIYCDTRVENPILDGFVKRTLRKLRLETAKFAPNVTVKILQPAAHQSYFVRVAGRGYPPPTTFFRWCTKDLRIRPVQKFVRSLGENPLIVLGTRRGESVQRDRVLSRAGDNPNTGAVMQRQMDGGRETTLYLPIFRYAVTDVWDCLAELDLPLSVDIHELANVYRHGGGECPMIREANDKPCSSARFGCWVCTVVRRDRSAENLMAAGFSELEPYSRFRNWISELRNNPLTRCEMRRNGSVGGGPFRLEVRREILRRVRALEREIGHRLVRKSEERYIRKLWAADQKSPTYQALEQFQLKRFKNGVKEHTKG